ncbi:MAG TPA: methyltransferase domain-containing protein [Cellvibrionaceae bacterium]
MASIPLSEVAPKFMPKQFSLEDRNFDDLASRFGRNIYGGLKGDIRLAVLNRDFAEHLPIAPYVPLTPAKTLRILDAGGGQGHFSLPFAQAGHSLVLNDLSANMLEAARTRAQTLGDNLPVDFIHGPVQALEGQAGYDLVLCHALLEWVTEPWQVLQGLLDKLAPGGYLSLIFYNQHALVYKNLLRTNYKKIHKADYAAFRGSLTPINPLLPEEVLQQLAQQKVQLICHSGIRVFYDYILDPVARKREPESVLALELEYSRQEPFRSLGRYVHMLVRKSEGEGV